MLTARQKSKIIKETGVHDKDTIKTLTDWAEQWIEYNQEECIAARLEEYERAREYAAENRRDAQ